MSTTTASTDDESSRQQRRRDRNSARPFHAAPIVELDDEDGDQEQKPSKMRSFLRAIGLGCLVSKGGSNTERRHTFSGRLSRLTRREPAGPALRAITIEDARYAFNQNVLDSEDGSVYSSYYDGNRGRQQQYVLFLGTEKNSNVKAPMPQRGSYMDQDFVELKSLRPSLHERQLPVFFTPPPPDIVASVTPRRRLMNQNFAVSPPGSPIGGFA